MKRMHATSLLHQPYVSKVIFHVLLCKCFEVTGSCGINLQIFKQGRLQGD